MINKDKYNELLEQYTWQFKLLDDLFASIYERSNIIVEYYINHFNDFLKLEFKAGYDKIGDVVHKTTMLSWLKENDYYEFDNPEKLLRELEVDWANTLSRDYANSYIAAKEGLPKELQDEIQRLWDNKE